MTHETLLCYHEDILLYVFRWRARTLGRHRKPNDVVKENKKQAALVWVGMLLTIIGCEEPCKKSFHQNVE